MKAPALEPEEFSAFYEAIHGEPSRPESPFPWQKELARLVCAKESDGKWPSALDVPTGAGKTAAIDIAVFHLALEAGRGAGRKAPVRILFVVDRRLVVDDAYRRAEKIAKSLAEAREGVLKRVADRLRLLSETPDRPLVVTRLRGGAPKDPDWIRTPCQPTVVLSTVDQVGSRLLFRGYGVSNPMRPVHAGLLGADALYLLDEAHLSEPFVQTVKAIRELEDKPSRSHTPFGIVTLSATQTEKPHPLLTESDDAHPVLGLRLKAKKPTELALRREKADDPKFAEALAEKAWSYSEVSGGNARVVAVVVNRVRRARAVFAELKRRVAARGEEPRADVALLIGRTRDLQREDKLSTLLPRMKSRREEGAEATKPLFVVATQCIEAGADLDFDALVTELAPLDSLRQRFGRLNRMGRPFVSKASVFASAEQIGARTKPDPIYGTAMSATWSLLEKVAKPAEEPVVDFGIRASKAWLPEGEELLACLAPRAKAPVLMPAFIEQWACTSPVPETDPEVSLFLHGPQTGPADVQIVWRADLRENESSESWVERLAVCPPSSLEAISVPLGEAKRWLARVAVGDVADEEFGEDEKFESKRRYRRALRWCGADDAATGFVEKLHVRPEDILVVPSRSGGCDEWGWNPESDEEVEDLGQSANRKQRGRDILRLSPALLEHDLRMEPLVARERAGAFQSLLVSSSEERDDVVRNDIKRFSGLPDAWKNWLAEGEGRLVRSKEGLPLALERRIRPEEPIGESTTEDDGGSKGERRSVTLEEHSKGIRARARDIATGLRLPDRLANDIVLAAFLHDAGKAHPTFKLWLYAGDEIAAASGEPLAKSARVRLGKNARDRANLPTGARHEVASLAFALAHPGLKEADDPELVLWLVGTHHGWGRPFFPATAWPTANTRFAADLGDGEVTSLPAMPLAALTANWVDMQERLTHKYGTWGLAHLESILRLADHRQSESEQQPEKP